MKQRALPCYVSAAGSKHSRQAQTLNYSKEKQKSGWKKEKGINLEKPLTESQAPRTVAVNIAPAYHFKYNDGIASDCVCNP